MTVKCSSCSGTEALHLVTAGIEPGRGKGRVLVYCASCRRGDIPVDVSVPLRLVTPDLFVALYELGYTESAPDMAAYLVWGDDVPDGVVERAREQVGRQA